MMTAKKSPLRKSKDGVLRRTVRFEVRMSPEEEDRFDEMYEEFRDRIETPITRNDFAGIIFGRAIEAHRQEIEEAAVEEGLL